MEDLNKDNILHKDNILLDTKKIKKEHIMYVKPLNFPLLNRFLGIYYRPLKIKKKSFEKEK